MEPVTGDINNNSTEKENLDEELIRIKSRIDWVNKTFNQGSIGMLISLLVSYLVTLEITNGVEKITIQEVLGIFKERLDEMNKMFEELIFFSETTKDKSLVDKEKKKFRVSIYKLFDLGDIFYTMINKCVTFGIGVHKLVPYVLDTYLRPLTVSMIDTILLTDTDEEFEDKMYEYLNERVETISNPIKKKLAKINILHNMLKQVIEEPIDETVKTTDELPEEAMIQMLEIKKKKK